MKAADAGDFVKTIQSAVRCKAYNRNMQCLLLQSHENTYKAPSKHRLAHKTKQKPSDMCSSNSMCPVVDCRHVPGRSRGKACMLGRRDSNSHVCLPGWAVRPLLLCFVVLMQGPVLVMHLLLPSLLQVLSIPLLLNLQLWF